MSIVGWDKIAQRALAHHERSLGLYGGPALATLVCPTLLYRQRSRSDQIVVLRLADADQDQLSLQAVVAAVVLQKEVVAQAPLAVGLAAQEEHRARAER